MELKLIARFIQHFITSLLMHYAKKLVFYIDRFFVDSFGEDAETVVCMHCDTPFRITVLKTIGETEDCPKCGNGLNISKED